MLVYSWLVRSIAIIVLACLPAVSALAVSTGGAPRPNASSEKKSDYEEGVKAVNQEDWKRAEIALKRAIDKDPTDADAYNYLGYTYRQLKRFDEALTAYKEALRLNPEHRGAHEYIGEAYLALKQPVKAREHLKALDKLCFFGCAEYDELKAAIENYEGNR